MAHGDVTQSAALLRQGRGEQAVPVAVALPSRAFWSPGEDGSEQAQL